MAIDVVHTNGNGKFVNQFKRLSRLDDDCLIVVAKDNVETKTISYSDFKTWFYKNLSYALSIGDMAYKKDFWYAKADHHHNQMYNRADYTSRYYSEDGDISQYDILATIHKSDGTEDNIVSPRITIEEQEETPIGTVKFVYTNKEQFSGLTGINSTDFNGWIIPDGSKIGVNDITNTNLTWTEHPMYNSDTQTVDIPLIEDFVRFSPYRETDTKTIVPQVSYTPSHEHVLYSASCDVYFQADTANGDFEFPMVGSNAAKTGLIYGGADANVVSETITSTVDLYDHRIGFTTPISSTWVEQEVYPTYDKVLALIYIGGSCK